MRSPVPAVICAGLTLIGASASAQSADATAGMTSVQMYHQLFEMNRMRTARAMVAAGNCVGALAYAQRTRSEGVADAVRRACPLQAGSVAGPEGATPEAEIAAFASDPQHPLFEVVRPEMSRLLREGRAASLEDAYTQAVAAATARARAGLPLHAPS